MKHRRRSELLSKSFLFLLGIKSARLLGGTFNQGEVYDPATDVWAELTPMPMSVHRTGPAAVGDTIYIPAGATLNGGTAQTNGTQAFTLK